MPLKSVDSFIGGDGDPQPILRETASDGSQWPDGAVFAITVRRDELLDPRYWPYPFLSVTEYFGRDGWPIGFPEDKKVGYFSSCLDLPGRPYFKDMFQTGVPLTWRHWTPEDWERFRVRGRDRRDMTLEQNAAGIRVLDRLLAAS